MGHLHTPVTYLLVHNVLDSGVDHRAGLDVVEKASTENKTSTLLPFIPEANP
jgi:hypothetical protein